MEEIEKEYEFYEISELIQLNIRDPYALILNIESVLKEFEKQEAMAIRKRFTNRIAQKVIFYAKDLLQEEEACWEKVISLIEENMNRLITIIELIDEDNCSDLVKLVDFMMSKYTISLAYYKGQLECLNSAAHGIQMIDYKNQDIHPQVMNFVDCKINAIKKAKKLEKN